MRHLATFALLLLGACRSEHGLNQPPPGYREPPPVARVKQTFDAKTGRVTHEWNEIAFADRRAVKDGVEVKYFANGQKMWEGTWARGQKRGTWRFWYESGALKSETIYAGPQTTTMTFWHPNGRVALRGPALDGSRQGLWRVWTQAGLLAEEGTYVGSVRQGMWKVYSDDGTRVTEIVYAKNVRVSAGAPVPCEPVWQEGAGPGAAAANSVTDSAVPSESKLALSGADVFEPFAWETPWGGWRDHQLAASASGEAIVFAKYSSAHAQPEKNGVLDTFVWSKDAGVRALSRVRSGGATSNHSCTPSMSSDGTRIAYVTFDPRVAQCGSCELPQLVLVDTAAGTTKAITASSTSARENRAIWSGVLSRDGREVVLFGNVGDSPARGGQSRFVPIRHDIASGVEQIAWSPPQGVAPDIDDSLACSASADHIVMTVHGLDSRASQIVRIRRGGTSFDVPSSTADGTFGAGASYQACISADGQTVAFLSRAQNLVSAAARADADVYVWQAQARRVFRPELPVIEGARYANVLAISLSDDGARLALTVELTQADWISTPSAPRPPKSRSDVVVCNLRDGSSTFVTRAPSGKLANGSSAFATLSGDGKTVAFLSYASNLAPLTDAGDDGSLVAPGVFVAQLDVPLRIMRID